MRTFLKAFVLAIMVLPIYSCDNDDDDDMGGVVEPTGEIKVYTLGSVADPSISGMATFIEMSDGSTTIELDLTGTPDGGMHPAHIHYNTAAESDEVAIPLGTVDGTSGFSTITVNELNDGTPITYDELLDFDGYINVHLSSSELGTIVAQGDIGQNELTGNATTYPIAALAGSGISGNVMFEKRVNGEALATIMLNGTPDGGTHPAHIHQGSVATAPGFIIFGFEPVDGTTGMSKTNVSMLEDDSPFGYDDVLTVDGYINIHTSLTDDTVVAQGNIGSND